jgi:hypothetical protein
MMRRRGPGLVRTVARTAVVAGTASAVAGGVHHRQAQRWGAQEAEQQAAVDQQQAEYDQQQQMAQMQQQMAAMQAQQANAAMGAGGGDVMTQLQKLADMKQAGILTDEEFAAAKAKLLG